MNQAICQAFWCDNKLDAVLETTGNYSKIKYFNGNKQAVQYLSKKSR